MVKWSSTGVVSKPASNLLMQLVEKRSCWERLARNLSYLGNLSYAVLVSKDKVL